MRWFLHEPHGGNWHPLTSFSHMLDVQLFGLAPSGHHAVSLALHILNALLVLLVLFRLTGAWWRSLLVAGLFALHPLRVESVAWISERKDVLSAFFFLLTLEGYRRWAIRPSPARYAWVIAGTALGLMSKPMLVTLPFVLVLLDLWPLGRLTGHEPRPGKSARAPARSLGGLILEKWPLIALAAASALVTFLVQRRTGAVASMGSVSIERRACNALIACWRYVGMTIWPHHLTPFYPFNRPADIPAALLAAAALALGTWLAIRQARSRPWLAVGWFWYLGMLIPVIGLIQVGGQSHADRYTYLPTIGLLVALVWGAGEWVARSRLARVTTAVVAPIVLVLLGLATAHQVARWKDTRTLFTYTLAVTRDNPIAHQCLGDVLLQADSVEQALPHYEESVRLAPGFADAHNKLGTALGAMGRTDEAIAQFRLALRSGESADFRQNLGFAYARQGRIDDAIREFDAALAIEPDHFDALMHLGTALGATGRLAESEARLRSALALRPSGTEARRALAVTLTLEGQVEEAIGEYQRILAQNPADLDALNNIAWIRATHAEAAHRNGAEAVRLAERARDASPEPVAILYNTLSAAYAEAGRFPEAIVASQRAIELARAAHDTQSVERYTRQLAGYRARKAFHFEN